jgi:hypothetical protein
VNQGPCVFRGFEGNLSEEDLIPKWANVIRRRLAGGNVVLFSTRQVDPANGGDPQLANRRGQSHSAVKIARICHECNKHLDVGIENDAKGLVEPTVEGRRVGFTQQDLGALATCPPSRRSLPIS